jgi:hypothetical protein
MYYINYKPTKISQWFPLVTSKEYESNRGLTIESFDYRHHAERALDEILYYDPMGEYWISSKACKNWTEDD